MTDGICSMNRQGIQDVVYAAYKVAQKEKQREKEAQGAIYPTLGVRSLCFSACMLISASSSWKSSFFFSDCVVCPP